MQVRTFLINLEDSRARYESAQRFLADARLEFQRVPAVDGRKSAARDFPEYNMVMARRRYGRPLAGGEVGCFLSHKKCVEEFVKSGEQYALVLEDDVKMLASFRDLLGRLVAWLDRFYGGQWDVVNLGRSPKKYYTALESFSTENTNRELCVAHYFPLTTTALLWSRDGAVSFLENSSDIYAPVDQFLRDWCAQSGRGLAFIPAPVSVTRAESEIAYGLLDRLKNTRGFLDLVFKNLRLARNSIRARRSMKAFES